VYNHLHTVHAIAAMQRRRGGDGNADGSDRATQSSLDTKGDDRPVPGEGHHVATCTCSTGSAGFHADITDGVELVVPVTVTDRSGTEVVHADITTWVTPRNR
jgi:hypothetical protein